MCKFTIYSLVLLVTVLAVHPLAFHAEAALVATDAANDAVYDDGWQSGDNGGSGFGAWVLDKSVSPDSGHFIGDSTFLAGSQTGANINTAGESFGMFGHSGQFAGAMRPLTGTLSVGETFSFVLAVNFRNGNKGFDLRNSSGGVLWNFNVGGDTYTQNGNPLFGNQYADTTAFQFAFTQNSSTLSWTITRSGDLTGMESGSANIGADTIGQIRFYISGTDNSQAQNNLYFNNLSVVPEPVNVALGIFGGIALVVGLWARRKRCVSVSLFR